MDPETIANLEDALRGLANTIGQSNDALSKQMGTLGNSLKDGASAANSNARAQNAAGVSATALSNIEKQRTAEAEAAAAATKRFNDALSNSKEAISSFAGAMLSASTGVAKYGASVQSATVAVSALAAGLGPLGIVAGILFKAFGGLAAGSLKLVDQLDSFRTDLTKTAGVIPGGIEGIEKVGREAGYSGENLAKLQKITVGLGANLVSLSGTAGSGVIKFGEIANVSDDVRRKFSKLGVSQEALSEMQAKYIESQAESGRAYSMQNKDVATLRRESLAYADNMMRLSALTGKSADALQKEQDQVMMKVEEQIQVRSENAKISELKKKGTVESLNEAKKIEAQQAARQAAIAEVTAKYGAAYGEQAGRVIRMGGAFDKATAGLSTLPINFTKVANDLKNVPVMSKEEADKYGRKQAGVIIDGTEKGMDAAAKNLATSAQYGNGGKLLEAFGVGEQMLQQSNKAYGKSWAERDKIAEAEKATALKKQGLADSLAKQQEAERELQAKYQKELFGLAQVVLPMFTKAMQFLTKNFDSIISITKAVAIGLAGMLVAVTAIAALGKGVQIARGVGEMVKDGPGKFLDKMFSKVGTKGNPLFVKIDGDLKDLAGSKGVEPLKDKAKDAVTGKVDELKDKAKDAAQEKAKGKLRDAAGKVIKAPPVAGGAASKAASGADDLGKSLAKLGKGAGKGLEGILKGLANGFKALGSPPVLLGMGAFTLAVMGIGAGLNLAAPAIEAFAPVLMRIAEVIGVVFIKAIEKVPAIVATIGDVIVKMTKAISTAITAVIGKIVSSVERLAKVDGKSLIAVGAGLGAIAVGFGALAAVTAGSKLGEGFSKVGAWFGGDKSGGKDPMDEIALKIKKFQSYNFNAKKVEDNSKAFVAYNKAIATIQSSTKASNQKGLMPGEKDNTVNIAKNITEFQKYTLDAKKVETNGKAAAAYNKATDNINKIKPVTTSKKSEGFAPISAMAEQITEFQKYNFDTKKIEGNSKAFVAFNKAMSSAVPTVGTSIANSISKLFGGKDTIKEVAGKIKDFQQYIFDYKKVEANGKAFATFNKAMSDSIPKSNKSTSNDIKMFNGSNDMMSNFIKFANLSIDPTKFKTNLQAFMQYNSAMAQATAPKIPGSSAGGGAPGPAPAAAPGPAPAAAPGAAPAKPAAPGAAPAKPAEPMDLIKSVSDFATSIPGSKQFMDFAKSAGKGVADLGGSIGKGAGGLLESASTFIGGMQGKILGLISSKEAKTYDTVIGGSKHPELLGMTIAQAVNWGQNFRKTDPVAKRFNSSAMGKYQMIGPTALGWAKSAGLNPQSDKFSPANQDKMVLSGSGLDKKINQLQAGKITSEQLVQFIGSQWQSWPRDPSGSAIGNAKASIPWDTAVNSVNTSLKAAKGGVFEGPTSGYPVQLHGKEIVAPLNVDSILMKLAKTPASEELSAIQKSTKETLPEVKANTDHHSAKLNMEMVSMLSSKLDTVINVLEGTHSTQTKILRHSMI